MQQIPYRVLWVLTVIVVIGILAVGWGPYIWEQYQLDSACNDLCRSRDFRTGICFSPPNVCVCWPVNESFPPTLLTLEGSLRVASPK